jgi:anaerobic magnesium-protoporphyrin IX monomethyl ester cyclase
MKILYLPNEYSQQRQREKKRWVYPILLAMEATKRRNDGDSVVWYSRTEKRTVFGNEGYDKIISEPEGLPFLELPAADRTLTRWWDYQDNGNFKYHPGTYILSASGCWHGKCTFCVEENKPYEVRPVEDVIAEIEECQRLGFREVFDDSATFPTGRWLDDFCNAISVKDICWGANMRVVDLDYKRLNISGCRMLLFGVESANQITLDRIQKGVKVEDIIPTIKKASEAGLEPHIAVMFGMPWETDEDSINTLRLVHYLLRRGYAKTAQASFYVPKTGSGNERQRKYVGKIYNVYAYPDFWYAQLREIKNVADIKYLWKKIKAGLVR